MKLQQKITILFILGAVALLGFAIYLLNPSNKSDAAKENASKPTNINSTQTVTPNQLKQPTFNIPTSYEEAVTLSKTGDPLAFYRIREYAKNAPQSDFERIKNNLAPLDRNTSIAKEMAEQRSRDIRMITYFPPELALAVLVPLTRENNLHKERCEAIAAVGELQTPEALDVIKNLTITNNNGEQEYREASVATVIALNRHCSKEAILYMIDTLDRVSGSDASKEDKLVLQKMIVTSLQNMSAVRLTPNFDPAKDNVQEVSDKWRNWYNNLPSGYMTNRENENRRLADIVKKRLDSNK